MGKYRVVTEDGRVVGEDHWRAKFTDEDIELMRQLRDPENGTPLSYGLIAEKFECSKSTVFDVCNYKTRAQVAIYEERADTSCKEA